MQLIFAPNWFIGNDIIIDVFSIVTVILISVFALKYYKLNKHNKNFIYLAVGFILIGAGFIFKILTNFTIYYKVLETRRIGSILLTLQTVKASNTLFIIGFLAFRGFMLLGLYILYSMVYHHNSKTNHLIMIYLILISTYFSSSTYFISHVTAFILTLAITCKYYDCYLESKNRNTKYLFYGFAILSISHLFFIFVQINTILYATAEIIQLLGYLFLLATLIMVLKHGKKKNKD